MPTLVSGLLAKLVQQPAATAPQEDRRLHVNVPVEEQTTFSGEAPLRELSPTAGQLPPARNATVHANC